MNWGAFAGGAAQGISRGIRDSETYQRLEREKKAAEEEEAWKAETKSLADRYLSTQVETPSGGSSESAQGQVDVQGQPTAQPQVSADTAQPEQPANQTNRPEVARGQQTRKPMFNSLADAIDFASEGARINLKYGKSSPSDFVNLMKIKHTLQKENMEEAVGRLHGGDFQGALSAYNDAGDDRVEYKGAPQQGVFEFAGQKIPTVIATLVDKNGQERTINTAQIMASKIGLDKTLDALYKNMQLTEQGRHNRTMEGVARTRAENSGPGGKKGPGSGKGKWIQNEDGEWEFLQQGETAPGLPKEKSEMNDDGTWTVYDESSGTSRTVYTEEQARTKAAQQAQAWKAKKGEGWFNREPGDKEVQEYEDELYRKLMEGSRRPQRGKPPAAGGIGGNGATVQDQSGATIGNGNGNGGEQSRVEQPAQQQPDSPVKKGVSIWTDPNSPIARSMDFGSLVGKPIAAAGESMGDTVSAAVDLIQKALQRRVSDADIKQIVAYAKEVNDPEAVAQSFLKIAGTPATNTDRYMQRTSSKNLNQYFR